MSLYQAIPYEIELQDRTSFVVTIDGANTVVNVTVTSDARRIQEWLNMAIKSYQGHIVSIHTEPRPFKSKHIPQCFQPTIRSLFVVIGPRVLVIHLRHSNDLPWACDRLSHLYNGDFYFLGTDMPRIRRWLNKKGCVPMSVENVRGLVAGQTGRLELRTAGLKKIVQAVLGRALDPWLSRRLKGWSSETLSPKLVMQGSIRAFMAFQVAQACLI